jgi:hypothetical protein
MPTMKPRVSITIDQDDLAILDRYSKISGQPRATVLADLARCAIPQLAGASDLIEAAQQAPLKVRRELINGMAEANTDMLQVMRRFGVDVGAGLSRRAQKLRQDPHLLTGGSKS